jgi:single-strand DNA-binding protein
VLVGHRAPIQFQVINLIGRLTAKPELRSNSNGGIVCLRVAVQRRRGKDGEDRGADFVDVTAFGPQAQNCAQYLTKGRRVGIVGRLHHSEWDAEDGRRQRLQVIADTVDFLDAPRETADTPATPAAA